MKPNKPCDPSVDYSRSPTFAPLPRPQYRCTCCGGKDPKKLEQLREALA